MQYTAHELWFTWYDTGVKTSDRKVTFTEIHPGAHLTDVFFPSQFKCNANFILLLPPYKHLCMEWQLCCHGICKNCCDLVDSNEITARQNFHEIWILSKKWSVKWASEWKQEITEPIKWITMFILAATGKSTEIYVLLCFVLEWCIYVSVI